MTCDWCGEPILPTEPMFGTVADALPMHHECGFRVFCGSAAHHSKTCSCYIIGSDLGDPDGMTKRQAAMAALLTFRRMQGLLEVKE